MKVTPPGQMRRKIAKNRTPALNPHSRLIFKSVGGVTPVPLLLPLKRLNRFILMLKWATKRRTKTFRKFWFRATPLLPLTRKVRNSRMGKGRGKFKTWFTHVSARTVLFELSRLRLGRALFFGYQIKSKLDPRLKIIRHKYQSYPFPITGSHRSSYVRF